MSKLRAVKIKEDQALETAMGIEFEIVKSLFSHLMASPIEQFPKLRGKLNAEKSPGVYVIYSPEGKVLHVGRTPSAREGIAQRLRNHMSGSSSFTKKHLKGAGHTLRDGCYFRQLAVHDDRQRALLESYAIGCLCPEHLGLARPTEATDSSLE